MSEASDEFLDQLAVLRAQMDQLVKLAPEIARCARAWMDAFRGEGFDDKQALWLAVCELLQNPGAPPG